MCGVLCEQSGEDEAPRKPRHSSAGGCNADLTALR